MLEKIKKFFKRSYTLKSDVDYKNKDITIHFASDKKILFLKFDGMIAAVPLDQLTIPEDPFSEEVLVHKSKEELGHMLTYCEANEMYDKCIVINKILNESKSNNI